MKLVIFGLTVSSSWGNGHATLWRGLLRALGLRRHRAVFFERDVPYYARRRDLTELPGHRLVLYADWAEVLPIARRELADADAARTLELQAALAKIQAAVESLASAQALEHART